MRLVKTSLGASLSYKAQTKDIAFLGILWYRQEQIGGSLWEGKVIGYDVNFCTILYEIPTP